MKRTFILLSWIILSVSVSAQTRISLYEGFTGENCGPCSSSDTLLNAVLMNNPSLIIPIMWEVPIISAPSNSGSLYQTNKAEINWRYRSSTGSTLTAGPSTLAYGYPSQNTATDVATNGINTAPTGRIDGQHQWAFGAASDDPSQVTNTLIVSAQTQTTNFRITMTPSWSPTYTNCVVNVAIQSTTSFTALGALMFRLCLVERGIWYPTPPGINGEKKFFDVVRKSYPTTSVGNSVTAMGTLLPGIWTPTQTQTFTVNCNIPAYIRDLSQMVFVGFIQDDGDRKVYQAERTAQPAIPNDISVVSVTVPLSCTGAFTPSFVAENLGPVAVTALTIAPVIDGVAQAPYIYNGTIAGGSTVTLALPSYTAAQGKHTFSMSVTGVSGGDLNTVNNIGRVAFGVSTAITTSVTETFTAFPPPNWYALNYDYTPANWGYSAAGGFSNSVGSAKYDFWNNYIYGDTDELFFPAQDFTGETTIILSFDVAYAQFFTTSDDKLSVMTSTNCGASWTTVYSKQGAVLATAPTNSTSPFIPNATQWRRDTVNLNSLANQAFVLIKFTTIAGFGNNLYIDNVNLGKPGTTYTSTAVSEITQNKISCQLFPNPSSGITHLVLNLSENDVVGITLLNSLGQTVYSLKNKALSAGATTIQLPTENLAPGMYIVNVATLKNKVTTKLIIAR